MLFDRLKAWLGNGMASKGTWNPDDYRLATAALLVEAASMDGCFDATERRVILDLLERRFSLDSTHARDLLALAEAEQSASDRVFKFALKARNSFTEEEREGLMEMLWTTILSDGSVHDYESNLMRRISGLLHVPDRVAGEARKRAARRLADLTGRAQGDEA